MNLPEFFGPNVLNSAIGDHSAGEGPRHQVKHCPTRACR